MSPGVKSGLLFSRRSLPFCLLVRRRAYARPADVYDIPDSRICCLAFIAMDNTRTSTWSTVYNKSYRTEQQKSVFLRTCSLQVFALAIASPHRGTRSPPTGKHHYRPMRGVCFAADAWPKKWTAVQLCRVFQIYKRDRALFRSFMKCSLFFSGEAVQSRRDLY